MKSHLPPPGTVSSGWARCRSEMASTAYCQMRLCAVQSFFQVNLRVRDSEATWTLRSTICHAVREAVYRFIDLQSPKNRGLDLSRFIGYAERSLKSVTGNSVRQSGFLSF